MIVRRALSVLEQISARRAWGESAWEPYSRFSNDSMPRTRSAQRARIVRACMSIWSRSAFVKNLMSAHASRPVVSSTRTLWRAVGGGRAWTSRYARRTAASMRVKEEIC